MHRFGFAVLLVLGICPASGLAGPPTYTQQQFAEDFDFVWKEIGESYAYFDKKSTDWAKVKTLYRPRLKQVKTREDFVGLLERVLEELYDHHAHLNTNTASSPRLVPSGADIWAAWRNDHAIVVEIRPGSNAERAGLKAGMEILSINGVAVRAAVDQRVGKSLRTPDPAARDWALRVLLAGRHNEPRRVGVRVGNDSRDLRLEDPEPKQAEKAPPRAMLAYRRLRDDQAIGYIRINNSLGSIALIKEFDTALNELKNSAGLILDLRDTPSGGNTTVARAIMGRFIDREGFYQKHSVPAEERLFGVKRSWVEIVSPRGDFQYGKPLVVLVDHWTGSMGEGIAIGLDGLKRATIVGTDMAHLLGAIERITLPNTKIGVNFPTEKLFHVNGTPREEFIPPVHVDLLTPENQKTRDVILEAGLSALRHMIRNGGMK